MEHAVIVHLRLDDNKFGTVQKRALLRGLQDELAEAIEEADAGEFDGDEFGQGECVVYMYGPDADLLYSTIESVLQRSSHAKGGLVVKRYGDASDPDAREMRIQL